MGVFRPALKPASKQPQRQLDLARDRSKHHAGALKQSSYVSSCVSSSSETAFAARLRQCCADINDNLDVEGLCKAFPGRVQNLVDRRGGRLKE